MYYLTCLYCILLPTTHLIVIFCRFNCFNNFLGSRIFILRRSKVTEVSEHCLGIRLTWGCICSVQSENSRNLEIALRILRIPRLRTTVARSRDCATIAHNLLPWRACGETLTWLQDQEKLQKMATLCIHVFCKTAEFRGGWKLVISATREVAIIATWWRNHTGCHRGP